MGNAVDSKKEQITYLQRRTKLLADVVGTMDESASGDDLGNVLSMLEALSIKVNRFKKDWDKQ